VKPLAEKAKPRKAFELFRKILKAEAAKKT